MRVTKQTTSQTRRRVLTHVEGLQPLRVVVVSWRPLLVIVVIVIIIFILAVGDVISRAAFTCLGNSTLRDKNNNLNRVV